jgi:hypothetical protein
MTTIFAVITRTNRIARALFHACAATDEQLVAVETLDQLGAVFEANIDAECDRIMAQHGRDSGWMCPSAAWLSALDEGAGQSLSHTTGSGRLTITARQDADEIELVLMSPSGLIARLVWSGDVTRVVKINAHLIAEKPARVDLVDALHHRGWLPYPAGWQAAVERARAMREAADVLIVAGRDVVAEIPIHSTSTDDDLDDVPVFTPDDFAPVAAS